MPKMGRHLGSEMRSRAFDVKVNHADVVEFRGPRHEGIQEHRWGGRRALDVDLVFALDAGDGLGRGDDAHQASIFRASPRIMPAGGLYFWTTCSARRPRVDPGGG